MPAAVCTCYSYWSPHVADWALVVRNLDKLHWTDDIEHSPEMAQVAAHSFAGVVQTQTVLLALAFVLTDLDGRHNRVGCSRDHLRRSVCGLAVRSNNQQLWQRLKPQQWQKIVEKIGPPEQLQRDTLTTKWPLHCEPNQAHRVRVG